MYTSYHIDTSVPKLREKNRWLQQHHENQETGEKSEVSVWARGAKCSIASEVRFLPHLQRGFFLTLYWAHCVDGKQIFSTYFVYMTDSSWSGFISICAPGALWACSHKHAHHFLHTWLRFASCTTQTRQFAAFFYVFTFSHFTATKVRTISLFFLKNVWVRISLFYISSVFFKAFVSVSYLNHYANV